MFVVSKNGRPFAIHATADEAMAHIKDQPDAPTAWGQEYEIAADGTVTTTINPRVLVGGWYRIDEVP